MKKAVAFAALLSLTGVSAFAPSTISTLGHQQVGAAGVTTRSTSTTSSGALHASSQEPETTTSSTTSSIDSRRNFLAAAAGALLTAAIAAPATPAHATYSAYARREEDWQQRQSSGQVQFSSAKALRSQLAEIAPANSERSRIFCPNGPSSAVSPLMENRCGDQQAAASVFGRTEDALGNSIPGFAEGYSFSKAQGANAGGMPDYGFTTNSRNSK